MFKYDIKRRRIELGKTLEDIGKAVGVNKGTVRKWETGYIGNMGRDKIELLAHALQISPSEFMGWEPKSKLTGDDLPQELRDVGIEWVKMSKKFRDQGLTPEQVEQLIDAVNKIKR